MIEGIEKFEERSLAENRFAREIHFKNEAFLIGILQAVSGASLVAGLSQLDTLMRLAPPWAVLAFLTLVILALAGAISAAYLKHSYKMWDMKTQATSAEKEQAECNRLANRDLTLMRRAMTSALALILVGYGALTIALWYRYATDPAWLKPSAIAAPSTTTAPAPAPVQPAASKKP